MPKRHLPFMLATGLLLVSACSASEPPAPSANSTPPPPAKSQVRRTPGPIRSDTFKIVHALDGDAVTVSLDTDLPDFTRVMVSVSRSYFEHNSADELTRPYFAESGVVGTWRKPRTIKVSHDIFLKSLSKQQQSTIELGIGSNVTRIEPEFIINFTVPVGQSDPSFLPNNRNLVGAAIFFVGEARVARAETRVLYPLDDAPAAPRPQVANRNELSVRRTYGLSRGTPLMPALNPVGVNATAAAIASRKIIPAGGTITITDVLTRNGVRWYRVQAHDAIGGNLGTGFVNADALIGQQVLVK